MPIPEAHKTNLQTIIRAAREERLAVMEALHVPTGKVVYALVAVSDSDSGEYAMVPMAMFFAGSPFDELLPPNAGGGFVAKDGSIVHPNAGT
jgi:hypothetical protein